MISPLAPAGGFPAIPAIAARAKQVAETGDKAAAREIRRPDAGSFQLSDQLLEHAHETGPARQWPKMG